MKINWKVRLKNPVFWVGLAVAIVLPILTSLGMSWEDMTTWAALGTPRASPTAHRRLPTISPRRNKKNAGRFLSGGVPLFCYVILRREAFGYRCCCAG